MSGSLIGLDGAGGGWRPEQRNIFHKLTTNLLPGMLVIYERQPYRVTDTRSRALELWPEAYRDAWVEVGMPEPTTWSGRPIVMVVEPEGHGDGKPLHLLGPAHHLWKTLPEHFAVCRLCHELPPCSHEFNESMASYAVERLSRDLSIVPGVCHGCREPISSRQKAITFDGENLIRPDLGDGTAIFHLKRSCRAAAESYDEKWAKAAEGRRRRLFCDGLARHHYDGTMDCTEGALCPGKVNHRSGEWHTPSRGITSGCWCVSGDLTARIEQQMRDGEVQQ